MTIAFIIKEQSHSTLQKDFFQHCFLAIATQHPDHTFLFIVDKAAEFRIPAGLTNAALVPSGKPITSIFRWKLFYGYTLPVVLKKHKVNTVVHSGIACSLRVKVPQCILVDQLLFDSPAKQTANNLTSYLNKKSAAFFHKATSILTITDGIKNTIAKRDASIADKTHTVSIGTDPAAQVIDWQERERIKETSANGKEYFLFSGSLYGDTNLLNLLKAFSFFKKRQKSNMQLLINTDDRSVDHPFAESLKTYKYRDDVQLLYGLSDDASFKILAAAYAVVDPALINIVNPILLNAMQSGVPVVSPNTPIAAELTGEAAIHADTSIIENLAERLMLVFKDEDQRNLLIKKGLGQMSLYSWKTTAGLCWKAITAAAGH